MAQEAPSMLGLWPNDRPREVLLLVQEEKGVMKMYKILVSSVLLLIS